MSLVGGWSGFMKRYAPALHFLEGTYPIRKYLNRSKILFFCKMGRKISTFVTYLMKLMNTLSLQWAFFLSISTASWKGGTKKNISPSPSLPFPFSLSVFFLLELCKVPYKSPPLDERFSLYYYLSPSLSFLHLSALQLTGSTFLSLPLTIIIYLYIYASNYCFFCPVP